MTLHKSEALTVTNVGPSPTFVHTTRGARFIGIGETVDADFVAAQADAMRANDCLRIDGDKKAAKKVDKG